MKIAQKVSFFCKRTALSSLSNAKFKKEYYCWMNAFRSNTSDELLNHYWNNFHPLCKTILVAKCFWRGVKSSFVLAPYWQCVGLKWLLPNVSQLDIDSIWLQEMAFHHWTIRRFTWQPESQGMLTTANYMNHAAKWMREKNFENIVFYYRSRILFE